LPSGPCGRTLPASETGAWSCPFLAAQSATGIPGSPQSRSKEMPELPGVPGQDRDISGPEEHRKAVLEGRKSLDTSVLPSLLDDVAVRPCLVIANVAVTSSVSIPVAISVPIARVQAVGPVDRNRRQHRDPQDRKSVV